MSRIWVVAVTTLGVLGCGLPALDVTGKACHAADRCPSPFLCLGATPTRTGTCQPETTERPGPSCTDCTTLELNGDFEEDLLGWEGIDSDSVVALETRFVHSGRRAALVRVRSGGTNAFVGVRIPPLAIAPLETGVTYCVSGWFQRGTLGSTLVQLVARRHSSTDHQDFPTRVTPTIDGWEYIQAKSVAEPPFTAAFDFRIVAYSAEGAEFYVDDFHAWSDPSGTCEPFAARREDP